MYHFRTGNFIYFSREFTTDVGSLTEIADGFIEVIDAVAGEVTKEKVKVIGARNRLQTIAKERETQVNLVEEIDFSNDS